MALVDNAWYVNFGDGSTTGYYAVTAWAAVTTKVCGNLIRQNTAPAVGSERVFVCIASTAGTGATGAAEPTWTVTRGAKNTDGTVTWQEATGIAALNGDLSTNTPNWNIVKNTAVTLGQVIQNVAGTLILICTTAGTAGNGAEPSWAAFTNAGATTADNTATWTTLGASFTNWSSPHARVGNALASTWSQAGNAIFVASDQHAETQSSAITLSGQSTQALPNYIYSVNRSNVPPGSANLASGASISTTGASTINIATGSGNNLYFYGCSINAGSGASTANITVGAIGNAFTVSFDACALKLNNTSTSSIMNLPANVQIRGGELFLNNTTLNFGATGQQVVACGSGTRWTNTASALLGTVPTTLFGASANAVGVLRVDGVDLSAAGAGKTIVGSGLIGLRAVFANCKLGASVTTAATPTMRGESIEFIDCDSGATNYFQSRFWYEGTLTQETTIVRTGGASDGTTTLAWKLAATANSNWVEPFESFPITVWNDSTSAITTLTIYGTTTGGGVPNNDDIWVEVEYLGSASSPQGSFVTTTKANNLAASTTTNNSADGSTWGGGGAGNGFKIVVPSFTPGQKGPINITIKVAKASATYYIDPKPVIN